MPIGLKSLLRNETRPLIQVRVTLRHVGSGGGTVTLVVSRALDSAMLVREVGEAVLVAVLSSTLVRHSRGLMRKGAKTNNRAPGVEPPAETCRTSFRMQCTAGS